MIPSHDFLQSSYRNSIQGIRNTSSGAIRGTSWGSRSAEKRVLPHISDLTSDSDGRSSTTRGLTRRRDPASLDAHDAANSSKSNAATEVSGEVYSDVEFTSSDDDGEYLSTDRDDNDNDDVKTNGSVQRQGGSTLKHGEKLSDPNISAAVQRGIDRAIGQRRVMKSKSSSSVVVSNTETSVLINTKAENPLAAAIPISLDGSPRHGHDPRLLASLKSSLDPRVQVILARCAAARRRKRRKKRIRKLARPGDTVVSSDNMDESGVSESDNWLSDPCQEFKHPKFDTGATKQSKPEEKTSVPTFETPQNPVRRSVSLPSEKMCSFRTRKKEEQEKLRKNNEKNCTNEDQPTSTAKKTGSAVCTQQHNPPVTIDPVGTKALKPALIIANNTSSKKKRPPKGFRQKARFGPTRENSRQSVQSQTIKSIQSFKKLPFLASLFEHRESKLKDGEAETDDVTCCLLCLFSPILISFSILHWLCLAIDRKIGVFSLGKRVCKSSGEKISCICSVTFRNLRKCWSGKKFPTESVLTAKDGEKSSELKVVADSTINTNSDGPVVGPPVSGRLLSKNT